ncbi:MAG: hypothetical protein RLZZ444_318, partial [Pseudomonadota bacterium]
AKTLEEAQRLFINAAVPVPPNLAELIQTRDDAERAVPPDPEPAVQRKQAKPRPQGKMVDVLDCAELDRLCRAASSRPKSASSEQKAAIESLQTLQDRGTARLVGLRRDWRIRLDSIAADYPNCRALVQHVMAACALARATQKAMRVQPVLLVGAPGIGKTAIVRKLVEVFGTTLTVYSLENAESTSFLQGGEKHWSTSHPGALYQQIVEGEFANPVMLLDEVDKAPTNATYQPINSLLNVLEPASARCVQDKSNDVRFDASYVIYIGTCNSLQGLSAALLSRFHIVHIAPPTPREAMSIAKSIAKTLYRDLGCDRLLEPPRGEVIQQLALMGTPRTMHRVLHRAIANALLDGRRVLRVEDLLGRAAAPDGTNDSALPSPSTH